MKRIIVSGSTGFIGSHFVKAAKSIYEVHVLSRSKSDLSCIDDTENLIHIHKLDGSMDEIIEIFTEVRPDILVHIASKFCSQHSSDDIKGLIDSNVLFGTQLLEGMSKCGCRKLINIGTSWQHYDNSEYNPVNLYAATKQAFKDIIRYYEEAERIISLNIELFDTYGLGDKRKKLLNLIKQSLDSSVVLEMSAGEQKINLLHVDDVVDGILIAINYIDTMMASRTYVLRSSEEVTLKELVSLIEQITGRNLLVYWGRREYRPREVMQPYCKGKLLPNWEQSISLQNGLKQFYE